MRIGKIVITLSANNSGNDIAADDEIGLPVPARTPNAYAANLNEWTGEDKGIARLEDNAVGVSGNICRKYYLNENYENMLVNWYYPDNIYPMNLEDHVTI